MKRWIASRALLALAVAAGGCQDLGAVRVSSRPPRPVRRVDVVILQLTPPTAMNWDNVPGPDGLQARIHFFRADEPLAVTVDGEGEVALYDGRSAEADANAPGPSEALRTWNYRGGDLESLLSRSLVGWGYGVRLGWGERSPKTGSVTRLARYHAPDGEVTSSRPLSVAVGPK